MVLNIALHTNWELVPPETMERLARLPARILSDVLTSLFSSDMLESLLTAKMSIPELAELDIDRTRPFDVGVILGDEWELVPDFVDPRALQIAAVHPKQFRFEYCLRGEERVISGHERIERLVNNPKVIRPDAQFCMALLEQPYQRTLNLLGHRSLDFPSAVFKQRGTGRLHVMGVVSHGLHFDRHMFPLSTGAMTSARPSLVLPAEEFGHTA